MQDINENNDELLSIDDVSGYQLPDQKSIVLDLANNKTLDTNEFTPIQMIYLTAKEKNITLNQFEVDEHGMIDSGCKKAGCFGRGYKGFAGQIPIPCTCLFPDKKNIESDGISINRKIVRNFNKMTSREKLKFKNDRMKAEGLKPIGNGLYGKIKKGTKNELLKYQWKEHNGKFNFSRVYESENYNIGVDLANGESKTVYGTSDDIDPKEVINDEMDRILKAEEYKAELDAYSRPLTPFGIEETKDGEVL